MNPRTREISERLAKATPGPWVFEDDGEWTLRMGGKAEMCNTQYYPWVPSNKSDWIAISHAPADIAYLLAENERMAAVVEAARECVGYHSDGTAAFQPECNGSAQGLLDALAEYDAANPEG